MGGIKTKKSKTWLSHKQSIHKPDSYKHAASNAKYANCLHALDLHELCAILSDLYLFGQMIQFRREMKRLPIWTFELYVYLEISIVEDTCIGYILPKSTGKDWSCAVS